MEILLNEKWKYQLTREADIYNLVVLCGTVGMFEVNYELTKDDIENYKKIGKEYISLLANKIMESPNKYI